MVNNLKKLKALEYQAKKYHSILCKNKLHGRSIEEKGGILILGHNYANSHKLFFGINPSREDSLKWEFHIHTKWDAPWVQDENSNKSAQPSLAYWRNCWQFFHNIKYIEKWIRDTTYAFLIPWRTNDIKTLDNHPLKTDIMKYSKILTLQIIEDHKPTVILVVGKDGMKRLKDFMDIKTETKYKVSGKQGQYWYKRNIYQWGSLKHNNLLIFQLPHFSRCSNKRALTSCATWLSRELKRIDKG